MGDQLTERERDLILLALMKQSKSVEVHDLMSRLLEPGVELRLYRDRRRGSRAKKHEDDMADIMRRREAAQ